MIKSISIRAEDKNKINHLTTFRVFRNNNTFFFLIRPIGSLSILIHTHTHKRAENLGTVRVGGGGEREKEQKKMRSELIEFRHTRGR